MSWIILAVIALVVFYVSWYYRYPKEVSILQTSLEDFSFDMLRLKQPLVIHDRVADVERLVGMWFPHNIVRQGSAVGPAWQRNRYKYMVMQGGAEPCDVYLYGAALPMGSDGAPDPEHALIAIHLEPLQILVVPRGMRYMCPEKQVAVFGIHDLVTVWLP
jgi:hypothetical protein